MKTSEVIREARNVLFERGWIQGALERIDGVCLRGAVMTAVRGSYLYLMDTDVCLVNAAEDIIGTQTGGWSIPTWNDMGSRTFDEVIEVLDKAEKIAEQMEAGQ